MSEQSHAPGSLKPLPGYQVDLLLTTRGIPWPRLVETLRNLDPAAQVSGSRVTFPGAEPSTFELRETQPGGVDDALAQTWDWPEAPDALQRARAQLTVHEEQGHLIERYERLRRLGIVLRALIAEVPTLALNWKPSQRLVDPQTFVQRLAHGSSVTDHAVNVRLFRIPDGAPGETIMDTLGLTAFGLPDLQIHFAGLDPMQVAPILLHYAEYVFDKGDVLDDEHLIRGIEAYEEWLCRRQDALAPPARPVVDIHPAKHAVDH